MAKSKIKTAPQLKYFAATPAGDWWYVSRGFRLEADRMPNKDRYGVHDWVVTGWNHDRDAVWIAFEHQVKVFPAEELGFAWVMEPVAVPARKAGA